MAATELRRSDARDERRGDVRDELARGTAALAAAGCDTPRLDAELLLAEALGADRAALVIRAHDAIPRELVAVYDAMLARRAAREPVAYILGRRAFRRLVLEVDARALIPRPETELLVEVGLTLPCCARVADVGTGSGAVALAQRDERPDLDIAGIDLDAGALALARANARRLGLTVRFACGDLLDGGVYDAVLANLPYVPDDAPLEPEITRYEPAGAVFAGPDGLELIRRLAAVVAARAAVSLLALEIGAEQADAVGAMLVGAGFVDVSCLRDLAGHERVIIGRR